MSKKLLLLALLNSFAMFSQIIFNDDFSSYSTGQPLSGQGSWTNNSSLNGGLGSCSGFGCVSSSIVNNTVSYPNYGTATKSLSISSSFNLNSQYLARWHHLFYLLLQFVEW